MHGCYRVLDSACHIDPEIRYMYSMEGARDIAKSNSSKFVKTFVTRFFNADDTVVRTPSCLDGQIFEITLMSRVRFVEISLVSLIM